MLLSFAPAKPRNNEFAVVRYNKNTLGYTYSITESVKHTSNECHLHIMQHGQGDARSTDHFTYRASFIPQPASFIL